MGTMVLLPAAVGTPVRALDFSGASVAAVLCGETVLAGTLREPDSWSALCPGAVGVAVRGDRVFTGRQRSVVVVDPAGRMLAECGPADGPLAGFAVSADGAHVALGGDRVASVWEAGSGRRLARRRLHDGAIAHLRFTGDALVTRCDEEFAVWSWRSRLRRPLRRSDVDGYGSGFALLPDGRIAGALGRDRLGIWTARVKRERSLQADDWVGSVAVAADGARIAARLSETVVVWSWPDGEPIASYEADLLSRGLCFDGPCLVAGDDAALMTWGGDVPAPDPERFVPALDGDRLAPDAVEAAARTIRPAGAPDPEVQRVAAALEAPALRAIRGLGRGDVAARVAVVGAIVAERAPGDEDARLVAEVVTAYAALGWPVPADLRGLWSRYCVS